MQNKDLILKRILNIEDKLFVSKAIDKALKAEKIKGITHTEFLDPHQRNMLEKAFSGYDDLEFNFNGGYEDAERAVAFFFPTFMDVEEESYFDFPFKLLNSRFYVNHLKSTFKAIIHMDSFKIHFSPNG